MNIPIKHHYIPQFIIKNFTDENGKLFFWNIASQKLEQRNPKSIFMFENLYTDINNHPEDIAVIERKFSIFEQEIATMLKNKILNTDEIRLTRAENDRLRLFLFLLSFRSLNRKKQYIEKKFDQMTLDHLKEYTKNDDYVDLWLRELNAILDCKSYKEIQDHAEITPTIKLDIFNEIRSYYMSFVDARSGDFIISDTYPTSEIYPIGRNNANFYLHQFFPLSPTRLMILNNIVFRPDANSDSPYSFLTKATKVTNNVMHIPIPTYEVPGTFTQSDIFKYSIKRIYANDLRYINALALNESRTGIAFNNPDNILYSLEYYQNYPAVLKNNYNKLIFNIKGE